MAKSIETETISKSIIYLLRRATGISYELTDISAKLMDELVRLIDTKVPLTKMLPQVKKTLKEHYSLMQVTLENDLLAVAQSAINVEPWLTPIVATKAMVNESLNHIMPESNLSTFDLIKRTEGVTTTSVINNTLQAYQQSWTHIQLRDSLRTTETQLNRHLDMIARTSVNAVSNNAKLKLYKKNSNITNRVLFSAHLDGKTSDICKSLDQKAFYLKDAPTLPLHPNERSHLVPILKGEKVQNVIDSLNPRPAVVPKDEKIYTKLGFKTRPSSVRKTGGIRNPSRNSTSPLKGTTTSAGNYEAWLRKQPEYYQKDIIGVKGTKAFRKGAKLNDVIEVDPMTQKQLDKAIGAKSY